ncbi:MAG: hypothetical protein KY428_12460 [Bacteroidetes bacterium]|nr:hypothetical protein [Bacteroidota bacterium]
MIKKILPILFFLIACEVHEPYQLDFGGISLIKVSGEEYDFVVGRIAEQPLLVQALDSKGSPLADVPIAWTLDPDANQKSFVSVYDQEDWGPYLYAEYTTDKDGYARCYVKLPSESSPGGSHAVEAKITEPETEIDKPASVFFNLQTLDITHTYSLHPVAGDDQIGKIGLVSQSPIKLKLMRDDSIAVWDYKVTFTSESPGWKVFANTADYDEQISGDATSGFEALTDGNGEISVFWAYGNEPGTQILYANVTNSSGEHVDGSPLPFTADVADLQITITKMNGDNQKAAATTGMAVPLSIKLEDENLNAVEGYEIFWETESNHSIEPVAFEQVIDTVSSNLFSSRSDKKGMAKVRIISGPTVGTFQVLAHVYDGHGKEVSGSPAIFHYSTFAKGSFTDPRDNHTYETIVINEVNWFAENLNYQSGNNLCYDNLPSNCDYYGSLYTWDVAKNACPAGWHLATDQEWKDLELYLGMDPSSIDDFGSARGLSDYFGLMEGEWSGLNFKGGGYYTPDNGFVAGKDSELSDYGYAEGVWTADEYNTEKAIWRVFGTEWYSTMGRYADDKKTMAYVRCVKD